MKNTELKTFSCKCTEHTCAMIGTKHPLGCCRVHTIRGRFWEEGLEFDDRLFKLDCVPEEANYISRDGNGYISVWTDRPTGDYYYHTNPEFYLKDSSKVLNALFKYSTIEETPRKENGKEGLMALLQRPKKHKRLPDWVAVGAPYYDRSNYVFKTFTETDLEDTDELKQLIEFGIYSEARCEVLATDEIEALIGKILQHTNGDKALVCSYNKKTNLVYMGHYTVTPEDLMTSWTLDGKPCCKMAYWSSSSGVWLRPC